MQGEPVLRGKAVGSGSMRRTTRTACRNDSRLAPSVASVSGSYAGPGSWSPANTAARRPPRLAAGIPSCAPGCHRPRAAGPCRLHEPPKDTTRLPAPLGAAAAGCPSPATAGRRRWRFLLAKARARKSVGRPSTACPAGAPAPRRGPASLRHPLNRPAGRRTVFACRLHQRHKAELRKGTLTAARTWIPEALAILGRVGHFRLEPSRLLSRHPRYRAPLVARVAIGCTTCSCNRRSGLSPERLRACETPILTAFALARLAGLGQNLLHPVARDVLAITPRLMWSLTRTTAGRPAGTPAIAVDPRRSC